MASRDKKKTTKAKSPPKATKGKTAAPAKAKPSAKKASHAVASKKGPSKDVKGKDAKAKDIKAKAEKPKAAKPKVDDKRNGTLKAGTPEAKGKAAVEAPAPAAAADKKAGPKGITIVQPKPVRKPRPKPKFEMPKSEPLIKPGGKWKPLIPSGPKATPVGAIGGQDQTQLPMEQRIKSKFNKRELEQFRQILMRKRAELVGDISNMEDEALRQNSGSLSNVPQHMAEQGTDTYDQGLSLDLAAVDRNLLREIDDALKRIEQGTYGICERTGIPIKAERLQEIPWARYSIEAAREMERRPYQE
jgi:RNA polymerase-binding protein DksA